MNEGITPEPSGHTTPPPAPKSGFTTSEFWIILVGMLVASIEAVKGSASGPWAVVATAALAALYALQRTSLKKGTP